MAEAKGLRNGQIRPTADGNTVAGRNVDELLSDCFVAGLTVVELEGVVGLGTLAVAVWARLLITVQRELSYPSSRLFRMFFGKRYLVSIIAFERGPEKDSSLGVHHLSQRPDFVGPPRRQRHPDEQGVCTHFHALH